MRLYNFDTQHLWENARLTKKKIEKSNFLSSLFAETFVSLEINNEYEGTANYKKKMDRVMGLLTEQKQLYI